VKRLGKEQGSEAEERLLEAMDDNHFLVQVEAAKALAKRGNGKGMVRLRDLMNHGWFLDGNEFDWVQEAAMRALGELKNQTACNLLAKRLQPLQYAEELCKNLPEARDAIVANCVKFSRVLLAAQLLWQMGDSRGRDHLIAQCEDKSSEYTRRDAIQAVAKVRSADTAEVLLKALKDSYAAVRATAAEALGELGNSRFVTPVAHLLNDKDGDVKRAARAALARLNDPRGQKLLEQDLWGNNRFDAQHAAVALARLDVQEALVFLEDRLQDSDNSERQEIVKCLEKIGTPRAIAILREARETVDADTSAHILMSLARMHVPGVVNELVALVDNPDYSSWVRYDLGVALAAYGHPKALEPLTVPLAESNWSNWDDPIRKLGQLGLRRAVTVLLPLLTESEKESRIRELTAFGLGCLRDRSAVPSLITAVQSREDWGYRAAAAHALGLIGDPTARPALVQATKDVSPSVRAAAAHARNTIDGKSGS